MASGRIALVAVHGVADQLPGATARSLADLLVASAPEGVRYRGRGSAALDLPVPPLEPGQAAPRENVPGHASILKAFLQSFRSDFQRRRWEAPATKQQMVDEVKARIAAGTTPPPTPADDAVDRGLAFTEYLLDKHRSNGAVQEAYETTRIDLIREAGERRERVQVYEMYWADLSRLSGAVPRILAEFATLIFRLSRLGRDTVDEARAQQGGGPARTWLWSSLAFLQGSIDWLFVNVLAQLFAQLLLFGTIVVLIGLAKLYVSDRTIHWGMAGSLASLGILLLLYRRRSGARALALPFVMLVAGAVSFFIAGASVWVTGVSLVVVLTLCYDLALRIVDERFPFTRYVGLTLWGGLIAWIALFHVGALGGADANLAAWRTAALYGTELSLYFVKWFWVFIAIPLFAWMLVGLFAGHGDYERKAGVSTGRLGLGVSLCAFVVMTMAAWALLTNVVDLSLAGVDYAPRIFQALPAAHDGKGSAQLYVESRYLGSTESFAPVAILLLALLVYIVVTLFPSVLAELEVIRNRKATESDRISPAERLGRWLTAGYRLSDTAALLVCVSGIVVASTVVYVFAGFEVPAFVRSEFAGSRSVLADLSQAWLRPLVLGAAGLVTALSLLGGVLSRYAPAVRAPLDVALDVDNWFREFPRKRIPRARILARYVALLEHIAASGCDKIVIVAHSQGCVISAETLRWLTHGGPSGGPRRQQLLALLGQDTRLLTMGNPLRQLYAARFPTLYRWVLKRHAAFCGPQASDIGVHQWLNAFTSGDYVGRWLWSRDEAKSDALGHPLIDLVQPIWLGRALAYDGFSPARPAADALDPFTEAETCIGVGAHTHYLEPDQDEIGWLVDYLVGSRYTVVPAAGALSPGTVGVQPATPDQNQAGTTA